MDYKHQKQTRIAIIVEVKKREMPFMSILHDVLAKKGYRVKLIPFRSLCTWRLMAFRPDIVLVNGLRHENPYFIKQVYIPKKLFKSKIACYYSEQVGYYNQSLASGYYNQVIFNNVDYHIAWGPHFANDLIALGIPRDKTWYIGSIQYDIDKYLKKSFETIKSDLSKQFNLPVNKNWILYADNIIEAYQKNGLYSLRRRETFDMVDLVATRNPDCIVIFRHHPDAPSSDLELAIKRFENLKNVYVIPNGHIFDWTCGISALIIWASTSSIQTMFMGKPVFGFITSDGEEQEKYWYKDIFPTFNNASQLAETITRYLRSEVQQEDMFYENNKVSYIKDWYYKKDGLSFERLCYLFDIIDKGPYYPLEKHVLYKPMRIVTILYHELRAWIGDIVKNRGKQKNITRNDIRREMEKYDISKFSDLQFRIIESQSGMFLKECEE